MVVRTQGCWNCTHFENGPITKGLWNQKLRPRDMQFLADKLQTSVLLIPNDHSMMIAIRKMDYAIGEGLAGMCLAGKAKTDLVEYKYLCDHWSGKDGASVARAGAAPDMLPAEAIERMDEKKVT